MPCINIEKIKKQDKWFWLCVSFIVLYVVVTSAFILTLRQSWTRRGTYLQEIKQIQADGHEETINIRYIE